MNKIQRARLLKDSGLSNKAIAKKLGLTEGTTRNYLYSKTKQETPPDRPDRTDRITMLEEENRRLKDILVRGYLQQLEISAQ